MSEQAHKYSCMQKGRLGYYNSILEIQTSIYTYIVVSDLLLTGLPQVTLKGTAGILYVSCKNTQDQLTMMMINK